MRDLKNGTEMSPAEVLRFNTRWSDGDREIISQELENVGAARCVFGVSGYVQTINVLDAGGQSRIHISKGTLYFKQGYQPDHPGAHIYGDEYVIRLTTHTAGGVGGKSEPRGELCGRCHSYEMSVTGECPSCDS